MSYCHPVVRSTRLRLTAASTACWALIGAATLAHAQDLGEHGSTAASGGPTREAFIAAGNGDEGDLVGARLGLEFALAPRKGLKVVPQIGLTRGQNVEDTLALIASADLQLRWYPLSVGPVAPFVEAGPGIQYSGPDSFPAGGTHANFRLRAGAGLRISLTPHFSLVTGYHWLHMSNASLISPNVGHDGPMYYLGAQRHP